MVGGAGVDASRSSYDFTKQATRFETSFGDPASTAGDGDGDGDGAIPITVLEDKVGCLLGLPVFCFVI